ncbi:ABC transporter [Hirsutella rhossiliensis]|uniref:ABC transporter domain-containing protein n=1 Tax=Hirsutella rhossiliensis TaxID=111463 RepID=A0A9P8MR92_9HYPO|nr:ABC transporter domain-containing protein [Hirsutella rhossiliensis]KAH0959617.1 ABC transporter domain-containing protein [Hirsutella rhossiliensis]
MITPAGVREGLQVAFAIITLFFLFVTFLIYYGRKRFDKKAVLPKGLLRAMAVGLVVVLYVAEVCLVALRGGPVAQNEIRFVSCILAALAWVAVSFRRSFLVVETCGLSLITLVFGIPLLVVEAVYQKALGPVPAHHYALLGVQAARLLVLVVLLLDGSCRMCARRKKQDESAEARPFLRDSNGDAAASHVSDSDSDSDSDWTSDSGSADEDEDGELKDSEASKLRRSGSWIVYVRKFKLFVPYLIPKKDHKVQACILLCIVCMIGDRFLNIIVPRQIGIITDKIVAGEAPYPELGLYLILSLAQGDSGLELIQALAKIPVEQFSYRQITNAAFNHVMNLGMDFHSDRDSAEVMKAIEQGEALTNVVKTAVLEIMPTIFDMIVAFVFLYIKFSSSVALCMMFASLTFLVVEVVSSTWNIENRRRVTKTERREARVMHQAVQGWLTVSAFNMFSYEKFRFGGAVDKHLSAKTAWMRRDAFIQALLQALVPTTFVMLAALVIRQIRDGHATAGDFVFLIQYWDYLIMPLKFLSHEYRFLMADLIDAERLLDLLTAEAHVVDKEGASALGAVEGRVEFDHVNFSYDSRRTAIHDVSFSVAPGETVALVGSTGSGKSSLIKLLMRYYDVTSGSIRVDGKDIRDVTQGSLRNVLGVVPQDPLLFNASIMENLRYAKLSASDDEVIEACRAAAIHDKITSFPDGYETNVGENGVRLSGGEIQRLAIARAFLKNPPILILDEATSAVDTETEFEIQEAIKALSTKRTTFVIAHRLSTVINANQILVLQDGQVVERGTHHELLEKGGRYHSLWHKQLGDSSNGSEAGGDEPLIDTSE